MLRVLRGSWHLATALLVMLTVGVPLPAALHGDANDDICETTAAPHDAGDRLKSAGPAGEVPQHCAICHWLRSLRALDAGTAPALTRLTRSCDAPERVVVAPCQAVPHRIPARAPPA